MGSQIQNNMCVVKVKNVILLRFHIKVTNQSDIILQELQQTTTAEISRATPTSHRSSKYYLRI
jgi:hypothetical protein